MYSVAVYTVTSIGYEIPQRYMKHGIRTHSESIGLGHAL